MYLSHRKSFKASISHKIELHRMAYEILYYRHMPTCLTSAPTVIQKSLGSKKSSHQAFLKPMTPLHNTRPIAPEVSEALASGLSLWVVMVKVAEYFRTFQEGTESKVTIRKYFCGSISIKSPKGISEERDLKFPRLQLFVVIRFLIVKSYSLPYINFGFINLYYFSLRWPLFKTLAWSMILFPERISPSCLIRKLLLIL